MTQPEAGRIAVIEPDEGVSTELIQAFGALGWAAKAYPTFAAATGAGDSC